MALCDYELPTFQQFQCAALGLYEQYKSGTWDRNKTLAYVTIGLGFAAKQFVASGTMDLSHQTTDTEAEAIFQAIATAPENAAFQVPWQLLLPILFQLLEKWLSRS